MLGRDYHPSNLRFASLDFASNKCLNKKEPNVLSDGPTCSKIAMLLREKLNNKQSNLP